MSCIPANPDISGIGVRVAIYAQNILSFIPAIWALWDGEVSHFELESVETQSTTILITAFAVLVSTIVQARTFGLSNFHATIVLSLSWMNNTNTFIYFLLYMHQKSHEKRFPMTWTAWLNHLRKSFVFLQQKADEESQMDHSEAKEKPPKSYVKHFFTRIVFLLGSVHLTMMAAVGLWLWSHPSRFSDPSSYCAFEKASIVILGNTVSLSSGGLQVWSILVYSIVLGPVLNLAIPISMALAPYIWWNRQCIDLDPSRPSRLRQRLKRYLKTVGKTIPETQTPLSIIPIVICLLILAAINVILIVDIEVTIQRNSWLQISGESDWSFGQTLALLLLLIPLRDLIDIFLKRRDKRRINEHSETLKEVIKQKQTWLIKALVEKGADVNVQNHDGYFATALQLVSFQGDSDLTIFLISHGADVNLKGGQYGTAFQAALSAKNMNIIQILAEHGADVNLQGGSYVSALQAASIIGDVEMVKTLLDHGADVDFKEDDYYGTALQTASSRGDVEVVKALLDHGADVNIQSGKHGTALEEASVLDSVEIFKALLDNGADVNLQSESQDGTALQAASRQVEGEIVKVLLDHGADVNLQGGYYGTALQAASSRDAVEIVKVLLDHGADVNLQGGWDGTALRAASYRGKVEVIKALLDHGADVNLQSGHYLETALINSSSSGKAEAVKVLLDHGADVNLQGGEFGTALQSACVDRKVEVVKVLLDHGADVNLQGGRYGTALQAASRQGEIEVIKVLLDHGADVNLQGGSYGTALHAAICHTGDIPHIISTLLKHGADWNLRDDKNRTPLQLAQRRGPTYVKLLKEYGASE